MGFRFLRGRDALEGPGLARGRELQQPASDKWIIGRRRGCGGRADKLAISLQQVLRLEATRKCVGVWVVSEEGISGARGEREPQGCFESDPADLT